MHAWVQRAKITTTIQCRHSSSHLITPSSSLPLSSILCSCATACSPAGWEKRREFQPPFSLSPTPSKLCNPNPPPKYRRRCYRHRHRLLSMRRPIFAIDNGAAFPPALLPYSLSPSPSPSPSPLQYDDDLNRPASFYFPSIPFADGAFDLATILLISGLLLLSLLSLSSIFHLRVKSRGSHHLQNFNNLWSVRLLLVSFVLVWALNEIPRLPFFRRQYLYPFLPSLTLTQQANLCKVHVVLSLGFFEPGFLVTLLYLVNISIKQPNHHNNKNVWSIASVFVMCLPVLLLQIFVVFLSPLKAHLPVIMNRSSVLTQDDFGNKTVMCAYPFLSCAVFAAFAIAYSLGFLLSCWQVVSMVINKGIRVRINALAFTVMVALPMQILFLGMSSFWTPETTAYGGIVLAMFICVAVCTAVGECILVIKPTADALAAIGDCCPWFPRERLRAKLGGSMSRV